MSSCVPWLKNPSFISDNNPIHFLSDNVSLVKLVYIYISCHLDTVIYGYKKRAHGVKDSLVIKKNVEIFYSTNEALLG